MLPIRKVGILTLHRSDNFGAMLQAYALSKFLRDHGFQPFIVNYHMEKSGVGDYLSRPLKFFSKVMGKNAFSFKFVKAKISQQKGKASQSNFSDIFEDFRREHLNITPEIYDYRKLSEDNPDADAFIVGSDQVWAADFVFSSPAFLLGFVNNGARKISYAASFGKATLEPYLRKEFSRYITQFDSVSVREKSGVDLIDRLTGVEAEHVLDPTLLLEDYSEIVDYSLVPDHPYLFSYRLGQSSQLITWMNDALDKLSIDKGLVHYVVSTNTAYGVNIAGKQLYPTPGQLLGLIERASLFATNSFHGTVFAILLRTQFLTFARDEASDKQNLRLTELLSCLLMNERYCPPLAPLCEIVNKIQERCDFTRGSEELEELRSHSSEFLLRSLKN